MRTTEIIRGLQHLSSGGRLRAGIFQPGEVKVVGTLHSIFQYLKRSRRQMERGVLQGQVGIRGNGFRFPQDFRIALAALQSHQLG